MDNIRLLLILSLAAVLFLIYQAWVTDYGPITAPAGVPKTTVERSPAADMAPPTTEKQPADLPSGPPADAVEQSAPVGPTQPASTDLIFVDTDVVHAEISPRGGTIQNLYLRDYSVTQDKPDDKLQLLKAQPPNMFIAQSGLLGAAGKQLPNHNSLFHTSQTAYRLADGSNELVVALTYDDPSGIHVVKRYRFKRGSYVIDASQEIRNGSDAGLVAQNYNQLQRNPLNDPNAPRFIHTYTGGVYYGPDVKYKKESFDNMREQPLDIQITDGWIAMIQHYFLAAWIPPQAEPQTFYTMVVNGTTEPRYIIGQKTATPVSIAPGAAYTFHDRLFAGPKLQDHLADVAPGLELTVDYGWLTIIAEPIFWLLEHIHAIVGNWGWSIIILTILIKLAFYKLSETSYKSMAHMRQVTPRMKALKDRYGDDKERLNQAMMELYKKEKVNPLGGCLPILVQIPVFISLYWVLLESVELRHAPFVLWLTNLTAPDPYYVLPLIMGVSMFVQQRLNPPPPDPMQEKIMMALPFVFTVFFAFFPSGLVLYWTVNQLLSIAQQWHITRNIEKAAAKRRTA